MVEFIWDWHFRVINAEVGCMGAFLGRSGVRRANLQLHLDSQGSVHLRGEPFFEALGRPPNAGIHLGLGFSGCRSRSWVHLSTSW